MVCHLPITEKNLFVSSLYDMQFKRSLHLTIKIHIYVGERILKSKAVPLTRGYWLCDTKNKYQLKFGVSDGKYISCEFIVEINAALVHYWSHSPNRIRVGEIKLFIKMTNGDESAVWTTETDNPNPVNNVSSKIKCQNQVHPRKKKKVCFTFF